jgi:hypothetical protein
MIRKLLAATAALLFVAGFGVATSGTATAGDGGAAMRSVIPHHGVYNGTDAGHRHVSFTFGGAHGNQMTHFTVGHQVFGGAHVSNGMWHETCHNGFCTKGQWTSDGHVTGAWRHGGQAWTTFTVSYNPPAHPYTGSYMGRDHRAGKSIKFSFKNNHVVEFKLDGHVVGNAQVATRHFETCHGNVCFKGHWQSEHEVVGSWRQANGHDWIGWEAWAFSS